jgi:hypothetical protein
MALPLRPKETDMRYKTMVLELIQQRPQLLDQLRQERKLMATAERLAVELKASHEGWKDLLSQERPGSDPSQFTSEALEIALQELEDCLPSGLPPDGNEAISIEDVMAFLRRRTPPA